MHMQALPTTKTRRLFSKRENEIVQKARSLAELENNKIVMENELSYVEEGRISKQQLRDNFTSLSRKK